ncbi:MAG: hypothetical protein II951_09170 [Bacteroidales bacterium]|nr:hypothetical protein [Bacteroidales bacterium]
MSETAIAAYGILTIAIAAIQAFNRSEAMCRVLSWLFVGSQVAVTIAAYQSMGEKPFGYFTIDSLGLLLMTCVTVVSAASFSHDRAYVRTENGRDDSAVRSQFYAALTVLTAALTYSSISADMAVTWIFIEITTLSASALIFYRRTSRAIEATWKYVFACSVSLVIVYIGVLFASISMGKSATEGLSYETLTEMANELDTFWLKLSFIFVLVGYTAKLSLVPMFTAGIDAKDEAPTPAAAVLSSIVMNAGFVGFYRYYAVIAHTEVYEWARMVVLATGLLSIFVAAVYLIRVNNIKRLFAYSSVEHIGVVMLGMAAGGIGVYAGILHLVIHTFVKSAVFLHVSQLYRVFNSKLLSNMGGYIERCGVGGTFVIIAMLCVTAMPPSGLFMTELMIFKSLIDVRWWVVLGVSMVILCTIVWAICRDMLALTFLREKRERETSVTKEKMPVVEMLWQFALIAMSIWLGLATPETVSKLIWGAAELLK